MKLIHYVIFVCLFMLSFSISTAQVDSLAKASYVIPPASSTITVEDVTLDLFFSSVPQGRAALMRVSGEGITSAKLNFRDKVTDFFYIEDEGYFGLLAVSMNQTPRTYDFSVLAFREDGTRVILPAQVQVTLGGFLGRNLTISSDRAYLIDPQVERLEFARLDSVFANVTPEILWSDEGFHLPIDSVLTSAFGEVRTFNETTETRHTGWDLRAGVGTPVMPIAAGRVAFAGVLDIRGNYVVIDHGYGIYSGYAHLSQIHVTRGQNIASEQIIGVTGNTGRSGGPHLHWELVVNGEWMDGPDFMGSWFLSK